MSNRVWFRLLRYQKDIKDKQMASLQLSPMNTIDVTLKTQNAIGGCLTQQINTVLFAMACQSLSFLLYQLRSRR